jgi:hypothetical protein
VHEHGGWSGSPASPSARFGLNIFLSATLSATLSVASPLTDKSLLEQVLLWWGTRFQRRARGPLRCETGQVTAKFWRADFVTCFDREHWTVPSECWI